MTVRAWLEAAGLAEYIPRFAAMTEYEFKSLLMADYGKFGVNDMGHKQRLYTLLKDLNSADTARSVQHEYHPHHMIGSDGLLDLDEHDSDLLVPTGAPVFQIPPMGEPRYQPQQQPQQDAFPMEIEEPQKIKVVVRKRPINRKERERQEDDIVDTNTERHYVIVNEPKVKVDLTKYVERHQFNFDEVLDDQVSNDVVYRKTVQPLVHTLFRNGKASCFAYGQTGSGKTYTMSPLPIRAAADIFKYLAMPDLSDVNLHVSCFEIYGNKCFDLLNQRKKLNILEDGKRNVVVVGLKEFIVDTVDTVKELIEEANDRRSTGSTAANADSSRSHSIMQFALKRSMPDNSGFKLVGKISFIDLAGSERGADTFDNNRQTRMEGAEINKSLLALKECIRALDSDARHVPFRGSKLTAVLKDSFIGAEARTVMIANISPVSSSVEHTLNTLRYADRVKELRKDKGERTAGGVTPGSEDYYASVARVEEPAVKPMVAPPPAGIAAPVDRRVMAPPVPPPVPMPAPPMPLAPSANPAFSKAPAASPHKSDAFLGRPASFKSSLPDLPNGHPNGNMIPASYGGGGDLSRGSSNPSSNANSNPASSSTVAGFEDGYEDELLNARNELMESIMEDEETLINSHRMQIERTMDIVRQEMNLLTEVDQPGSAIDQYVERLEVILREKAEGIAMMQRKLEDFKAKLKEEEIMSKTVQQGSRGKTKPRY